MFSNGSLYKNSVKILSDIKGCSFQVGTEMNIVKDRTFDKCLYKTLEEARNFINSQLREFTHLNQNGIFETVPEYPEFAWYEGLVNAVTHRDYSNTGEYIIVKYKTKKPLDFNTCSLERLVAPILSL